MHESGSGPKANVSVVLKTLPLLNYDLEVVLMQTFLLAHPASRL